MSDFTFLTEEQCFGDDSLDILKIRGTEAAITDFSVLLGGWMSNNHISSDKSLEGRTGFYWTKSNYGDDEVRGVASSSKFSLTEVFLAHIYVCDGGARIALPFSNVSEIPTNGKFWRNEKNSILEVEYGYYPQKSAPEYRQEKLERAYQSGKIKKTRNTYTTDSKKTNGFELGRKFLARQHEEYEFEGKIYVRVEAGLGDNKVGVVLSNGKRYKNGDYVWVEVLPVKWLVDEKAKIMITEKIIFAGVQFNHTRKYHIKDFDKTDIKIFMDKYFYRDLVQTRKITTIRKTNGRKTK